MDSLAPLLVLALAVWARLGRRRRADIGRAVEALTARLREVTGAGAPTASAAPPVPAGSPPRAVPSDPTARTVPDAAPRPAPRAPRPAPRPLEPVNDEVPRPPAEPAAAPSRSARARTTRRLDVRRDVVVAELLAVPVALRDGGPTWR